MTLAVRCANPDCRHEIRRPVDALGRSFRCGGCGSKLLGRPAGRPGARRLTAPWESEPIASGRTLGLAFPGRIGKFRVLGLLSRGAEGTIYRATFAGSDRPLALQVHHSPADVRVGPTATFMRRAEALAGLCHPAFGPIEAGADDAGRPYLAAPLERGTTLADLLATGPADPARAAALAVAVAEALSDAHDRGVAHGAVRPSSVVVGESGDIRLTGFEIAGDFGSAGGGGGGQRPVPASYVAPERAGRVPGADPALCDQHAVGVLLYQMLCGRPPFIGPDEVVLDACWNDDPLPPGAFRPGVPAGLGRVCLRAVSRRPADRYPDCGALSRDLRRWLSRREGSRRALGYVREAGRRLRRRPLESAAAAFAMLVLAGSALHAFSPFTPGADAPVWAPAPPAPAAQPPRAVGASVVVW